MPEDEWKKFESRIQIRQFPAGFTLFGEGDAADGVYLICEGQVDLWCADDVGEGLRWRWRRAQVGDVLGAVTVSTGMPAYPTTAETVTPCLVRVIPKRVFLQLLEDHREIERRLFRQTSLRLYHTLGQYRDLAFSGSTLKRVARLLFQLYEEREAVAPAEVPIKIVMGRQEMAERVAAAPETVSRALSHLVGKKIIERQRGATTILDPDQLKSVR
jgi:CRP/FNR family transcriptional regulator